MTKQNKTKQNKTITISLTNLFSFKLFIVVFSLILFSVSCGNDDKTGSGGGGNRVSLPDADYSGTLQRNSLTETPSGSGMGDGAFPNPANDVNIYILNGGIGGGILGMAEAGKQLQIYQDGSGYYASGEYSTAESGMTTTVKTSIKFTISDDKMNISQYEQELIYNITGAGQTSAKATYSGTLTKQP